jgi:transcriptional regulator with XRE-family HTH domain
MNKEIITAHAQKLRFLRKQHDKKQSDIAHFLEISQQAYSKLENGDTAFSEDTIEKIARFFGISPADFEKTQDTFYIGNNSYNHSSNIQNINERFIKMYETLFEQHQKLSEQLIQEKDERIKLLESLLKTKN